MNSNKNENLFLTRFPTQLDVFILCLIRQVARWEGIVLLLLGMGGLLGCGSLDKTNDEGLLIVNESFDGEEIGSFMSINTHFQLSQLPKSHKREFLIRTFRPNYDRPEDMFNEVCHFLNSGVTSDALPEHNRELL